MKQEQIQIIMLEAGEGMTLTNGDTYSKLVYLGINDSPSNWYEISDEEVPNQETEML